MKLEPCSQGKTCTDPVFSFVPIYYQLHLDVVSYFLIYALSVVMVYLFIHSQGLLHLRHLDLSYNEITDVEDLPTKVGGITSLNIAGNHLKDVKGKNLVYCVLSISDHQPFVRV